MVWLRFALEQAYEGVNNVLGDPFSPEVLVTVASVTGIVAMMQFFI